MQNIATCLWFNQQAEEAARFYTSVFKNGKIDNISRFGEGMPGQAGGVMAVTFRLGGQAFMALNGGPQFSFTPAISFFVACQTPEEIDTLWARLSEGGSILMELGTYPFSEKFGWLMDPFGVTWQLSLTRQPQQISPYLLFVGAQHGRAEEAIKLYTSLFPNASIQQIERHSKDQGETEGTVMHAVFTLNDQEFVAMDSGLQHDFTFTPAISFMVYCDNQQEVDHFWYKLTEQGEEGQCGWLEDPFGVSWQIIPTALNDMMNDPDPERAGKVIQALLQMQKIDIGLLEQVRGR